MERVEDRWAELQEKIRDRWGELTEDEIAMADGHRDEFIVRVKAKYGDTPDDVRRQFHDWVGDFNDIRGGHANEAGETPPREL